MSRSRRLGRCGLGGPDRYTPTLINPGMTVAQGVRFCDMEKTAIILETADELRAARLKAAAHFCGGV